MGVGSNHHQRDETEQGAVSGDEGLKGELRKAAASAHHLLVLLRCCSDRPLGPSDRLGVAVSCEQARRPARGLTFRQRSARSSCYNNALDIFVEMVAKYIVQRGRRTRRDWSLSSSRSAPLPHSQPETPRHQGQHSSLPLACDRVDIHYSVRQEWDLVRPSR